MDSQEDLPLQVVPAPIEKKEVITQVLAYKCSICNADIFPDKDFRFTLLTSLKCGHIFHANCLRNETKVQLRHCSDYNSFFCLCPRKGCWLPIEKKGDLYFADCFPLPNQKETIATQVSLLTGGDIANINQGDNNSITPLLTAIGQDNAALVAALLKIPDIAINQSDDTGDTPLLLAIRGHAATIVYMLLADSRINVNRGDEAGCFPLLTAIQYDRREIALALIAREDVNVNQARFDGITPLIWAIEQSDPTIVKALLDRKDIDIYKASCSEIPYEEDEDVNRHHKVKWKKRIHDKLGLTVPFLSDKYEHKRGEDHFFHGFYEPMQDRSCTAEHVLEDFASPQLAAFSPFDTALSTALRWGYLSIAYDLLLQPKEGEHVTDMMDEFSRRGKGPSPLFHDDNMYHIKAKELLKKTRSLYLTPARKGRFGKRDNKGLPNYNGYQCDVNHTTDYGMTLLVHFTIHNRYEAIQLLMERKDLDVNKGDENGNTPLLIAAVFGKGPVFELFINHPHIDVNKGDNNGRTPLLFTIFKGVTKRALMLLKHKDIDIYKANTDGITPLALARRKENLEVVAAIEAMMAHDLQTAKN